MFEIFECRLEELPRLTQFVRDFACKSGLQGDAALGLELAADEAASNIIKHACDGQESGEIKVIGTVLDGEVQLELIDNGKQFNPTAVMGQEPDQIRNDGLKGGYGLLLMRHFTDGLHYSNTPGGQNRLVLKIRLNDVK